MDLERWGAGPRHRISVFVLSELTVNLDLGMWITIVVAWQLIGVVLCVES